MLLRGPVLTHSQPSQAWHNLILGLHPCGFVHVCSSYGACWMLYVHTADTISMEVIHVCSLSHPCPAAGSQGGSRYQLPHGRSRPHLQQQEGLSQGGNCGVSPFSMHDARGAVSCQPRTTSLIHWRIQLESDQG